MKAEFESFADHEYEPQEIHGRMTLKLHGEKDKRKEVVADKIPKLYEAMREGWDIDIEYAVVNGDLDIEKVRDKLMRNEDGRDIIRGKVSIVNSTISGDANFSFAQFSGSANFSFAQFSGSANFSFAQFSGSVDFCSAQFSGYANFSFAQFSGGADFSFAQFKGRYAGFSSAQFSRHADFSSAQFSWPAIFADATFGGKAFLKEAVFGKGADFEETRFGKTVDLHSATFEKTSPENFVRIGLAYRKSSLSGGARFFERAGMLYLEQSEHSEALVSFRNAKLEYEKEGEYDKAGEMYVQEKESERLHLKAEKNRLAKRIWFRIWKLSSKYGESPWRFIGLAALIVLGFAVIYMPIMPSWFSWWPSITFKEYPFHNWSAGIVKGGLFNVVAAVYYSAVTFATLGFGDITPVNIVGRLCTIAEVLLGYLMFGVLITLVARKMTRS